MNNKLKEIKQFLEYSIVKMQEPYNCYKQEFHIGDEVWIVKETTPAKTKITEIYDHTNKGMVSGGIVRYGLNEVDHLVNAGDDFFRTEDEAKKYFLYMMMLNCTISLFDFNKP
ncbi:MAG: hypothetical protein RLY43_612 [Bacteroidota bacterium]|jgi:hypothetical protein